MWKLLNIGNALFCLLISFSCTNHEKSVVIKVDCYNPNKIMLSDLIEKVEIVPLETDRERPLGEITQLIKTDKHLIILDSRKAKKIFVYDHFGSLKTVIESKGKGRGEISEPQGLFYDHENDVIGIHEAKLRKIVYYNISGEFVREIGLPKNIIINEIYKSNNKIYASNYSEIDKHREISVFDEKLQLINKYIVDSKDKPIHYESNYFFPAYKDPNLFYYIEPTSKSIYSIDDKGTNVFCSFDFGNDSDLERKVINMNHAEALKFKIENEDINFLSRNVVDSKDFLLFSFGIKRNIGLLDKKSMKAYYIQLEYDKFMPFGLYSLGGDFNIIPNNIISELSPLDFINVYEFNKKNNNTNIEYMKRAELVIENLNTYDNSILIFYQINKNFNITDYITD